MCPLCLSTAAWLAIGGTSTVGIGALIAGAIRLKSKDEKNDDNRN